VHRADDQWSLATGAFLLKEKIKEHLSTGIEFKAYFKFLFPLINR
jgi:hypothetical protein